MTGTKFYKPLKDIEAYSKCAEWCNANGCMIKDMGDHYQVVEIPVHIPTEAEIQAQLTQAVQAHMDSIAQTRGYDNIHTACSYSNSTDHIFAAEGQACLQWRDMVWRKCYNILAEVQAGSRDIPTAEELIAELPVLEW